MSENLKIYQNVSNVTHCNVGRRNIQPAYKFSTQLNISTGILITRRTISVITATVFYDRDSYQKHLRTVKDITDQSIHDLDQRIYPETGYENEDGYQEVVENKFRISEFQLKKPNSTKFTTSRSILV